MCAFVTVDVLVRLHRIPVESCHSKIHIQEGGERDSLLWHISLLTCSSVINCVNLAYLGQREFNGRECECAQKYELYTHEILEGWE